MPPKRASTTEAPVMTQDAIRKLVADSVTSALEAQATTMHSVVFPTEEHLNAYAQPMGIEQANQIPGSGIKKASYAQVLSRTKIQEDGRELYNLIVNEK
ncbi:hypothetical protein Tco_0352740 [Tanacetum coccineum]